MSDPIPIPSIKAGKNKGYEKLKSTGNITKNPDYIPKGSYSYDPTKTMLTRINSSKENLKKKLLKLLKDGRIRIKTKEQLLNFPLGSLVAYTTKQGKYRSGGFLRTIQDDYFCLQGGSIEKPVSFCVQFKNVHAMYVKSLDLIHKENEERDATVNKIYNEIKEINNKVKKNQKNSE